MEFAALGLTTVITASDILSVTVLFIQNLRKKSIDFSSKCGSIDTGYFAPDCFKNDKTTKELSKAII
jgi:hypothetical protein